MNESMLISGGEVELMGEMEDNKGKQTKELIVWNDTSIK